MWTRLWIIIILLGINNIDTVTRASNNSEISQITKFSDNILLSTTDDLYPHHVEVTMAISDQDAIFVGWKNALTHYGPGVRVSFTRSLDNGRSWSDPFNMPHFNGLDTKQSDPWMIWNNGVLYYAYMDYMGDFGEGFSQLTVATSFDNGETWNPVTASNNLGLADKETIAVSDDGTIYVAYSDFVLNNEIEKEYMRVSSSTDGGLTYYEKSVIAEDDIGYPYVTTDSFNRVYVAYVRFTDGRWGDVYLSSSNDGGLTFSDGRDINRDSENATSDAGTGLSRLTLPNIRFDQNNRLYALWAAKLEEGGEWDIYIRYSDDYGESWGPRYRVNPTIAGMQWHPDMDFDSEGRCHIVYYEQKENSYKPYYRMITFPRDSTSDPIFSETIPVANVSTPAPYNRRPGEYFTIRLDSKDIPHVVWSDGREGEMDIYYSHGVTPETSATSFIGFPLSIGVLIVFILMTHRKKRIKTISE
ncbi:MAG: sialidase family protein [Candidatus Heimdallarchaeota archaeon]